MKRITKAALAALILLCLLSGCTLIGGTAQKCSVNFYINGDCYTQESISFGGTASLPVAPDLDGYIFTGWYIDPDCTMAYDFSSPVIIGFNLYGNFVPDAVEVTRIINEEIVSSVVTVNNKSYNTIGGIMETDSFVSQGSGVVIDISGGYCYVLTNCHVIEKNADYSHQRITVEDSLGNSYEAKLYRHPDRTDYAKDDRYDLALICFTYVPTEDASLKEIKLGENSKIGDYVVSVGTPLAQKNSVVFGRALEYRDLSKEDDEDFSNMDFNVLLHSASLGHGSSGGPVISMTGELVGINFAGVENSYWGFSIPISVVREFLDIYAYNR